MRRLIFFISSLVVLAGCQQAPLAIVEEESPEIVVQEVVREIPESAEVPILIYHQIREVTASDSTNARTFIVSPDALDQQMRYLAEQGFVPISFATLFDYFDGKGDLPTKPVIISFDDGVTSHYKNAFPVLQKHGMTATFFIFTNPVSKSENYMTWEQLKELVAAGMEIGGHGYYHLYIDRVDEDEQYREVVQSKEILEENLDTSVVVFAHPFGEYDEAVIDLMKTAGYRGARGISNGTTQYSDKRFELDGYFITENFNRFVSIVGQ